MSQWEYRKIALNDTSHHADEIDLLNKAGSEGWELVAITPLNVAYLMRPTHELAGEAKAVRRNAATNRTSPRAADKAPS